MLIKESDIGAHVEQVIRQINAGVLAARQSGIDAELPDHIDFNLNVLATDGLNAIERRQDQFTDGDQTTEQITPAYTEVTEEEPVETISLRDPTKNETTSTRTTTETESVVVDKSDQSSQQHQASATGGSDKTTTEYEYE